MKRKVFVLLFALVLMTINNSYAEKARSIVNNTDSNYHTAHLEQHLNSTDLHGTGNYLKIRKAASAWSTQIILSPDGSFIGDFGDSDMGNTDEAYPNGTHYFCGFSGQFVDLQKINDYTYSMTLDTLTPWEAEDHILGGVMYIASDPYGFESGRSFLIYTPDAPIDALSESFFSWMYGPLSVMPVDKLGCYAIYNQETGYAFFLAAS